MVTGVPVCENRPESDLALSWWITGGSCELAYTDEWSYSTNHAFVASGRSRSVGGYHPRCFHHRINTDHRLDPAISDRGVAERLMPITLIGAERCIRLTAPWKHVGLEKHRKIPWMTFRPRQALSLANDRENHGGLKVIARSESILKKKRPVSITKIAPPHSKRQPAQPREQNGEDGIRPPRGNPITVHRRIDTSDTPEHRSKPASTVIDRDK